LSVFFPKYKRYGLIVLLLVVILLLVCSFYNQRAELSNFKNQMLKFELSEQKYLETIDENGNRIVEQEQIILTQTDAISNNLIEIKRLKEIKSQVVINTITQIDSVFVPFLVDSASNDTISTDNYIIIPKRFALNENWYNIKGKIQKTGLLIDTLSFNNELSLTIGSKSQGIFKKPKPIVLVEYSNPYVRTQSMQNIIIKNELKFYDKKSFWYGLGVGTGILIPALIK
tara:strand:- start:44 stop:727 length:684 start_codon:yes stop_codon:yes gene_type:complete